MTKKFWLDWQKRIGETVNIYTFFNHPDGWKEKRRGGELWPLYGKIVKAVFHGDIVDLIIEINRETLKGTHHIENKYLTLHREDIATVEFKTYWL